MEIWKKMWVVVFFWTQCIINENMQPENGTKVNLTTIVIKKHWELNKHTRITITKDVPEFQLWLWQVRHSALYWKSGPGPAPARIMAGFGAAILGQRRWSSWSLTAICWRCDSRISLETHHLTHFAMCWVFENVKLITATYWWLFELSDWWTHSSCNVSVTDSDLCWFLEQPNRVPVGSGKQKSGTSLTITVCLNATSCFTEKKKLNKVKEINSNITV